MKAKRIAYLVLTGFLAAGISVTSHAQQPAAETGKKAAAAKPGAAKASPKKTAGAAKLAPGQKQCRSKLPDGSLKTWTCGSDQPCCVNHTFNLYTCGSQLLKCF